MMIYPAIDIKDGQCVRLVQGRIDDKTVYSNHPADMARSFEEQGAGWLHIVDLDGAFTGLPQNMQAIKKISAAVSIPFQAGGGLRSRDDVKKVLDSGASRVIIGTKAVTSPEFIVELLDEFGPEKIILGIDAQNGMVKVEGWVADSQVTAVELGRQMKSLGIVKAVFTDISRDGLLQGPNMVSLKEMAIKTGLQIIASGGVSTIQNINDLQELVPLGLDGAIIGKAIYDGKITLSEALEAAAK